MPETLLRAKVIHLAFPYVDDRRRWKLAFALTAWCYPKPRAISHTRAGWTWDPAQVTCRACRRLLHLPPLRRGISRSCVPA